MDDPIVSNDTSVTELHVTRFDGKREVIILQGTDPVTLDSRFYEIKSIRVVERESPHG